MQTNIIESLRHTPMGAEADRILRSCVHCGFCNATCPTYQELGDELDGPRGRIYQIKSVLEGAPVTRQTQQHLDRCLTCLNCTTTCPSGVEYNRLVDIGREYVDERLQRPILERITRWSLRRILPYPRRFVALLRLGQLARPLVPKALRAKIPPLLKHDDARTGEHPRQVILLDGCVQPTLTPATDAAAIRVFDRLGISVIRAGGGCCGAVSQHLGAPGEARGFMRRNIDAWWPHIETGAEAILVTASGCGAMVKDYGYHLRDDPEYAERAARVSALACDLCEIVTAEDLRKLGSGAPRNIAFHPPCTLQHGQKLQGRTEALLVAAGFELQVVRDAHSCCGSAGTYSILQPGLSQRLLANKLDALQLGMPALVATANVGCQTHLQTAARVPVVHWIELFDPQRSWPS
ncbi:MAG: glycolate oxidase subunit GlcF [Gammaproteobacteria bacterium]|nr:glycolate oxidase subunit GlcF [Gammaproteobacteria bacterium]